MKSFISFVKTTIKVGAMVAATSAVLFATYAGASPLVLACVGTAGIVGLVYTAEALSNVTDVTPMKMLSAITERITELDNSLPVETGVAPLSVVEETTEAEEDEDD